MGHNRVGIILGDRRTPASPAWKAIAAPLLPMAKSSTNLIVTGDFTYAVGYDAALDLLRRDPAPTAILAQNDDMAAATLAAARAMGLAVPDELSVAGFDDSKCPAPHGRN
jgi:LacI family transcriptional regulator